MKKILRPYFFITLCGILAYAPISFMLRAMKNDVVALEYPINHFISQCIHNGEWPLWFNTWGMGFPLQSNITWGIFSTPQLLFSTIFDYNIQSLHIEFVFYILLSGWSMFYLLKRFFVKDEKLAQMLALAYMLSGFMVGSTQWMLYITAAAYVPLLLSSLLVLLEKPGWKKALQAAVIYTIMFTSVYAALNIITTYSLVAFLVVYLFFRRKDEINRARINYLLLMAGITALLCVPCLYFTMEVLQNLDRGNAVAADTGFFYSNYLHPAALSSMYNPFSSVKMQYANTEGSMLNSYMGLFVFVFIPLSVFSALRDKNKSAIWMLASVLIFLLISFGGFTPLRKMLNILPGFSYFRHPAIFRFYFILSAILFLGILWKNKSLKELLQGTYLRVTVYILTIILLLVILFNLTALKNLSFASVTGWVKNMDELSAVLFGCLVQLFLLLAIILTHHFKKWEVCRLIFAADLVINTVLCTPFFSVSSYTPAEVNALLHSVKGFPVQQEKPSAVNAVFTDVKGNNWQNVNIFYKKVSSHDSYRGPLLLENTGLYDKNSILENRHLVFVNNDSNKAEILLQRPTHVRIKINFKKTDTVTLLQNYFRGWTVTVNNKRTELIKDDPPGIKVIVPAGEQVVEFIYTRNDVLFAAICLHLVVLLFWGFKLASSLSSRH